MWGGLSPIAFTHLLTGGIIFTPSPLARGIAGLPPGILELEAQGENAPKEILGEAGRGGVDEVDDDAAAAAPVATVVLGMVCACSTAQEETLSTVVRPWVPLCICNPSPKFGK